MEKGKKNQEKNKMRIIKVLALIFWILVWHLIAKLVDTEVFVASPKAVLEEFASLFYDTLFWKSIFYSLLRILSGFILAVAAGVFLAVITSFIPYAYELFYPLLSIIKSTPVASFIILILLWVKSGNVPVVISFLMVLPIIWGNVSQGIKNTDKKLIEMSKVFGFSIYKKIKYIYIPQCGSYFYSACTMGIGFAWKSGIAAEVLSTPKLSIGVNLYNSKIYLETPKLFAWTIIVIVMSVLVEKIFKAILMRVLILKGTMDK